MQFPDRVGSMGQSESTDNGSETVGSLATALAQAGCMISARPDLAEIQAQEILKVIPREPNAMLLLGRALRLQNKAEDARRELKALVAAQPAMAAAHLELG